MTMTVTVNIYRTQAQATSPNTVTYKLTYNPVNLTYTVWVTPNYSVPNANNSNINGEEHGPTAQVLLAVPNGVTITNITDIVPSWDKTPTIINPATSGFTGASALDPNTSYYAIGKSASDSNYGVFTTGVSVALFTFKVNTCLGAIRIVDSSDPFIAFANANALNVACSFYSRSGQAPIVTATPLEQFNGVSGTPAICSADFYVGGRFCIEDIPTSSTPPPATGTTPPDGCSIPTSFFDTDLSSDAWQWNFGDGATSITRNPNHQYTVAGTYTISLTRTIGGTVQPPASKTITIGDYPKQPLFNKKKSADTTICDGKKIKLDPYKGAAPSGVRYLWYPNGETTPTIDVDKAGCYSVEVFNATTGCSRTAKINLKICLTPPPETGSSEMWYFGNGATLDFKFSGDKVARDSLKIAGDLLATQQYDNIAYSSGTNTKTNNVNTPQGSAMVFDPSGSLKFYTDGKTVWDAQDLPIPTLSGDTIINPNNNLSQGTLLIPKSSCNECPHHQYYALNIDANTHLLSYSVIDLRYNGGKGAITELNVPLLYPATDRINAIINPDGAGFTVIAHEAGSNNFSFITIDSTGIRQKTQAIGFVQATPASQQGYLAISTKGDKVAQGVVINGKNYVEVYDFDQSTNTLSNLKQIDLGIAAPPVVYGLAFAKQSSVGDYILYVTLKGDPSAGETSYIYQLNLNLPDPTAIGNTKALIDSSPTYSFGAIQQGPVTATNGATYMYIAVNNSAYLPYIQNPNNIGGAAIVGFEPISSPLAAQISSTSKWGLPTIIAAKPKDDGEGISATYSGNCFESPTVLEIQPVCSPLNNKVEWDFGGGVKKIGANISYQFPKIGWNTFKVTISILSPPATGRVVNSQLLNTLLSTVCQDTTLKDSIYIKPTPKTFLPNNLYLCFKEGANSLLAPKPKGGDVFYYLWKPMGATTPTYDVRAAGNITLELKNEFDCLKTYPIKVTEACEPRLTVPTAFSPNGDSQNDTFVISSAYITDFHLVVFDRWGELVFESNDVTKSWDGTIRGGMALPGVYTYTIQYKSFYYPLRDVYTYKGFVTLLK